MGVDMNYEFQKKSPKGWDRVNDNFFQTTEAICFIHGWVWMPVTPGVLQRSLLSGDYPMT
nr:hypothetical protein [Escherichia coli]